MSKLVKFSDIVLSLESGSRPKGGTKSIDTGVPSLGAEHLDALGGFNFKKVKYIPEFFFDSQKKGRIEIGDILIVKDGATTAKTSFVGTEFKFAKASINEHLFKVKVDETKALPKYVYWHLFSPNGKNQILKDFRGATVGGIGRSFIEKVFLPLPPLDAQKRIVAILDQADALRQKRKQAIALLDEYVKSVFLEMFGDPVTNPKGWETTSLQSISKMSSGSTPSRDISEYYGGRIPWVKTTEVNYKFITNTEEFITDSGLKNSSCKLYPKDSILIAMYGQGKTRGKVGIL